MAHTLCAKAFELAIRTFTLGLTLCLHDGGEVASWLLLKGTHKHLL